MSAEERTMARVAESAARRFAQGDWGRELDDLRQEAWVAMLEVRDRWDPARGSRYLRIVVDQRLGQYMWRATAPVTGPLRNGRRLRGIQRHRTDDTNTWDSDLRTETGGRREVETHRRLSHPPPDHGPTAEEWWARLRRHVRRAVAPGDWEVAVRVLRLPGHPRELARDVARGLGWPVSRVHRTSSRVRRTVARDPLIQEEWVAGAHP